MFLFCWVFPSTEWRTRRRLGCIQVHPSLQREWLAQGSGMCMVNVPFEWMSTGHPGIDLFHPPKGARGDHPPYRPKSALRRGNFPTYFTAAQDFIDCTSASSALFFAAAHRYSPFAIW
ncbi:hypothetical protein CDAR_565661 [Caerostris darwini]|uniref:Uncharacterized protein n=1 Tax=Caerostris darwini TaxID=1538125 RepID=A0AAV4UZ37_9ARAC|nr:hypothetical protein CDAR_565661 [Caerostris darwini]